MTLVEFLKRLRMKFAPRIISSWLIEFGYVNGAEPGSASAHTVDNTGSLHWATQERGPRIEKELDNHAKRLAERAQMNGPRRVTAESSVIR